MSKLDKASTGELLKELNDQRERFAELSDRTQEHVNKIYELIDKVIEQGDDPYYYMTPAERKWLMSRFIYIPHDDNKY